MSPAPLNAPRWGKLIPSTALLRALPSLHALIVTGEAPIAADREDAARMYRDANASADGRR